MIKMICTIKDSVADAWLTPLFWPSVAAALRSFQDAVNGDSDFAAHPEDYILFKVGEFNELTGQVRGCPPELVASGINLVKGDS